VNLILMILTPPKRRRLQSKEHVFQAKATAEFARLRRCQAELEVETGQLAFVGLSVVDSLRQVGPFVGFRV
jgi:hypothetical protein